MKVVAAVLCMLLGLVAVSAQDSFLLVAPEVVRPGTSWPVSLELLFRPETTVTATVKLTTDWIGTLAKNTPILTLTFDTSTTSASGSIEVPDSIKNDQTLFAYVEFEGVKIKSQYKEVTVKVDESTIIVQTDKGMYKPGDTVRMRALQLDGSLLPVQEELILQVKNPKGSILIESSSASSEGAARALLDAEMTISEDPIFGQYAILANTATSTKTVYFKVEEYVLPRFDVKLTLANGPRGILVKVVATYTYGKPVPGKLTLVVNRSSPRMINEFDGDHEMELPFDEVLGSGVTAASVKVVATVSEIFTDITVNATGTIMGRRDPPPGFAVKAVEPLPYLSNSDRIYSMQVELTGPKFMESELGMYRLLYEGFQYGGEPFIRGSLNFSSNPQTLEVPLYTEGVKKNLQRVDVWAVYANTTVKIASEKVSVKPPEYSSYSGDNINIQRVPTSTQNEACFKVDKYSAKDILYYMVLTNVGSEPLMQYNNADGHCFTLTTNHAPASMVLVLKVVTYSSSNRELLVSSLIINSNWEPRNQVSLEISPKQVEPGQEVDILVQAQANTQSMVGLAGVDMSTELLAEGNKMRKEQLLDAATKSRMFTTKSESENIMPMRDFMPWDPSTSARNILQQAGLIVLTNNIGVYPGTDFDFPILEAAAPDFEEVAMDGESEKRQDTVDQAANEEEPEDVRSFFPETWLWTIDVTNNDGALLKRVTVPDTITSWVVDAFAFNSQTGLGLAQTQEVKVLKDYFLVMNLPYALVRGEEFTLEVLIFNYMRSELEVKVTLDKSDQFLVNGDSVKLMTIGGSATGVAEFAIKATEVGDILLRASVDVTNQDLPSDIVERLLLVKPEGREERISKEMKLNVADNEGLVNFDVDAFFAGSSYSDEDYVPDSLRMILYVTGDLMGPMIGNLENKIQMPYGCGEQNMKTVIPNIVVYKYLKHINRLEPEISAKAKKYCTAGYIKELNYQHANGAFSAFGEQSGRANGSTWLTAFVLKSFSQMKNEDIIFISDVVLQETFDYLYSMFTTSTTTVFREIGTLIHTEMKGGTSSEIGFSAFCVNAIMEYKRTLTKSTNDILLKNVNEIITKATVWLRSKESVLNVAMKPYPFAISAYTLANAAVKNDDNYNTAFRYLEKFHEYKDSKAEPVLECPPIWFHHMKCEVRLNTCQADKNCTTGQMCCPGPCGQTCSIPSPPYKPSGPSMTEMHAYVLLAYTSLYAVETDQALLQELKKNATDEMTWLIERRKAGGFFESTQDTAIAMEALAQYAITFPETTTTDFTISAVSGGQTVTDTLYMNNNNFTHLAERKLAVTSKPGDLKYRVGGTSGVAFATLLAIFNIKEESKSEVLDIKVNRINTAGVLRQCVTVLDNANLGTMLVTNMKQPSGIALKSAKSSKGLKASRIELDSEGTLSAYYMDDEGNGFKGEMCVDVEFEEEIVISNRQRQSARVMDYYNLQNSAETLYQVDEPVGCTDNCPTTGAQGLTLNLILGMWAFILALILCRK